jgi:N-acetylglucosamine-6-phosphate deacetylase
LDLKQKEVILEGYHYRTRKPIRLGINEGFISRLEEIDQDPEPEEKIQSKPALIAPGLVDLQINGYGGVDFNDQDLKSQQIESVSKDLIKLGVCSYYPTVITGPGERTSLLIKTLADTMQQNGLASEMIGGIHLEGPFISREDGPRGAHPQVHCLKPDLKLLKEWQELAGGMIKILTLAPELEGSEELIQAAVDLGMVVGIGHTTASSEDIVRAADAGATLSTHLGNGSHKLLPRHPNYIWDQLAEDRLYASMIADGFHLPDAVLRVFSQTKGIKAILISDGMPYTGLAPGLYESPAAGRVNLTPEGKLHLEHHPGTLAGSASTLQDGIRKMAGLQGFPFAWDMASLHPNKVMRKDAVHGLQVGAPADLVLLHPDTDQLIILQVYKSGKSHM